MRYRSLLIVLLAIMLPAVTLYAQDEGAKKADDKTKEVEAEKEKKELKLEDLFPKKSFFGPSARSTSFSFDGKYATYMYRPYIERRHGNDIWLLNTETKETKRLTTVVVMSEFMESVRKVKEDREKKAKKAGIGKKKKNGDAETNETTEEDDKQEVAVDDDVSGTWEGKITGPEELGLPPEGMAFTLTLILHTDNSVTGMITAMGQESDLTEGNYDPENGQLTARIIINADAGDTAELNITISDDTMKGEVTAAVLGAVLQIEGKRIKVHVEEVEEEEIQEEETEQEETEELVQDEDKNGEGEGEIDEEKEKIILGNWVGKKDADDEKAPRYSGISSYVWSPVGNEFIFTAAGDLYRYIIEDSSITRLTKTSEYERSVQYLPDGSGYTYMRGSNVLKVAFGSHLVDQLDPKLPSGESMMGYELSPDGTRMVFMTRKVLQSEARRTVNIMTFRGRFAEVRQVPRHVSDDKLQRAETSIWLYDMNDSWHEEADLKKVYTHNYTGPRDILQVPEWAPNSEKVCFAVYTQKTGNVEIYEASFPEKEEAEEADKEAETKEADKEEDTKVEKKEKKEIQPARIVYKFYHNGGPTTPRMIHPYYFADSHRMVFLTEMSGFRQLHTLDPTYEALEQITHGQNEVYPFGISRDNKILFATSTMENPSQEDVYAINLEESKMTRLSKEKGVYSSVAISQDGTKALANHVTYGELRELQFMEAEQQKELTESHPEKARELTEPMPEFFTYKNRHGHTIYGHMFKPDNWTAEDKRPLLIYVYGGPLGTSKTVVDGSYSSASYFFAYYMAKKHGYVTCSIDPRGVSGFGAVFEKANYEQVGKPQVEDIVDAGKWFIKNQGVDPDRIAMHGWSFGGFQTQMCLYTEPDFFNCGIAGAGPTEWENYNSWYSQGTIGKTGEGTADLKKFSLLPLAKNLKAKLLLIHGMEDPNVLYQDTVKVYRELLKAGKETLVELFLDPTGSHGLGGDIKTINRYRKYEDFLIRCMGKGEAVVIEEQVEEVIVEEPEKEADSKDKEEVDKEEDDK